VKICRLKSKWHSKSKVKVNVLNLNNKVKFLYLLKGSMSLAEAGQHYRKNGSSICKQH
jgi:hypothetical protein